MLVDVSLGLSLESWIRGSGHDAVFVREIDPLLSDSAILQRAQQEDRIVVTMDRTSASWYSVRNIRTAVCCV